MVAKSTTTVQLVASLVRATTVRGELPTVTVQQSLEVNIPAGIDRDAAEGALFGVACGDKLHCAVDAASPRVADGRRGKRRLPAADHEARLRAEWTLARNGLTLVQHLTPPSASILASAIAGATGCHIDELDIDDTVTVAETDVTLTSSAAYDFGAGEAEGLVPSMSQIAASMGSDLGIDPSGVVAVTTMRTPPMPPPPPSPDSPPPPPLTPPPIALVDPVRAGSASALGMSSGNEGQDEPGLVIAIAAPAGGVALLIALVWAVARRRRLKFWCTRIAIRKVEAKDKPPMSTDSETAQNGQDAAIQQASISEARQISDKNELKV